MHQTQTTHSSHKLSEPFPIKDPATTLWEAGHYYKVKGATQWSQLGWQVMEKLRQDIDRTMLFIDDIHGIENLSEKERNDVPVTTNFTADYIILESNVRKEAFEVLHRLQQLSGKKGVKENKGKYFCSGIPLTDTDGNPLCSLLDAGLTLVKYRLGVAKAINVLPYYYENQQRNLHKLVQKGIPEVDLKTILFNAAGAYWELTPNS